VAKKNTELYEDAFKFIPRNKDPNDEKGARPASIWPVWNPIVRDGKGGMGTKAAPMPFDREFWAKPPPKEAAAQLDQVGGYITLLPIEWTMGENNNLGYHTALVTENKVAPLPLEPTWLAEVPTDKGKA
jgi:phospholipase D1/2